MIDGKEFLPVNADLPNPVEVAMAFIPGSFGAGEVRARVYGYFYDFE